MPRWIALLRAVNLGARNRVPMAELRTALAEAGYRDVRTYLQSGNAGFTTQASSRDRLARELRALVAERFGVEQPVLLRSADELAALVDAHPFGADVSATHVAFLEEEPAKAGLEGLAELDVAPDRFVVAGRDVFLLYPDGVQGSRLSLALLERRLGVAGTARTWRTVTALPRL